MNGLKQYLLAILVPLVAMVTILSLYFYQKDSVQLAEHIKENELRQLDSLIQISYLHLNTITEDLNRLTYQLQQEPLHEPLRVLEKANVLKQFKSILITSELYDSIRLIDYKNSQVLLLDKVKDGFHIDYSKVIEEPQELKNIDHTFSLNNKISYIYKHQNKVSFYQHLKLEHSNWVVQLSYHQIPVSNIASNKERTNFIINNDAKWITQPYLNKSLTPSRDDNTSSDDVLFSVTYPYLWNAVKRLNKGQTIIGDYLYTYTPLIFKDKKLNKNIDKNTSEWVLISSLNFDKELNNLYFSNFTRIRLTAIYITFFILIISSAMLIRRLIKNRKNEQILRKQRDQNIKRYTAVIKNSEDGIVALNKNREITAINDAAFKILNIHSRALQKPLIGLFYSKQIQDELTTLLNTIDQLPNTEHLKTHIKLKYKRSKHLEVIATKQVDNVEDNILLHIADITYWVNREKKLQALSRAAEQSAESVIITDKNGFIQYVNTAYVKMSNKPLNQLIGSHSSICINDYIDNKHEQDELISKLVSGQSIRHVITKKTDNDIIYMDYTISPIRGDDGNICNYIATSKDITDRVSYENRLHRLAHYDALTQLPNRTMFTQDIAHSMQEAIRHKAQIAIIVIDLELTKQLHESMSNEDIEKILLIVSKRIKSNLRETDVLARIDTNEFGILIRSFHDLQTITQVAERLLQNTNAPLSIDSQVLSISTNIGIALSSDTESDPKLIQKYAHMALYRAKGLSGSNYCYFTESMEAENIQRLILESDLRKSVGSEQYEYFYQPKVNANTHTLCGVEALLRWKNSKGEYRSPIDVIPVLESSELIIDAGRYLINQACLQLKSWQDKEYYFDIAINISARQLLEADLVETITQAINNTGCNPHFLELELTESVLMCDVNFALKQLKSLRKLGIKIAIDDFGTGYSSLAYLSRFPINILKVDREFIKDLPFNKDSITICRSIIELAHNLNLTIVAEGVETEVQLKFLESLGVEELQGFYFDKPLPLSDFERKYLNTNEIRSTLS
ncbi:MULTISPECIES: EAL domain-containing protein [unclassified Photobacterium]|uniref:EAL domain-containing protein n=1 Tax=unclassified Photobacterium TaxID=2628852 RepID=UPI000D1764CA|nr:MULTISPECIES: EAL domain-containing protein [unclassified Photobacterium]PSV28370.1 GGDEF domain-containing protein [Photobacterium sp. GB-56]PSV30588.1 GGDEF domain-containing protein [Photobacterium sp. GB-72]